MIHSSWEERIERAARLEKELPAAADVLRFYGKIAGFQKSAGRSSEADAQDLAGLLTLVEREGTPALTEAARNLQRDPASQRSVLEGAADDPVQAFFSRVIRQAHAARAAAETDIPTEVTRNTCPFCGERPVVAVLRPEGDGGKRGLICSLCFTEWEFRRLFCPNCGEEDHRKLPVYKADAFPHVRTEACDSCRHYIKAVDLTLDGLAVPEVDELAAIPLDLWAREKDYIKLQANILGL
jgi:FdhE protein